MRGIVVPPFMIAYSGRNAKLSVMRRKLSLMLG